MFNLYVGLNKNPNIYDSRFDRIVGIESGKPTEYIHIWNDDGDSDKDYFIYKGFIVDSIPNNGYVYDIGIGKDEDGHTHVYDPFHITADNTDVLLSNCSRSNSGKKIWFDLP